MALTHFAFGRVGAVTGGSLIPVMLNPPAAEGIAPSGSNQQTTATSPSGGICRVATDTAVYVAFGSNPNALSGTGSRYYVPADSVEYFQVSEGHKAAVVTA